MKSKSIFLLFLIQFLVGCNGKNSTNVTNDYSNKLSQKEAESQILDVENHGELISTIEFELKAKGEDLKIFEDGKIPWMDIKNPQSEIVDLLNADEVVINDSSIEINIDYPLNKPLKFLLESKNGFTRKQLALEISKKYNEIYAEEEKGAKTKTVPLKERKGIINRNETDGKYGIWGHDIEDLDLGSIQVYKTEEGKIELFLNIES